MFAQGGIKVNGVVAQPYNVYASAAGKQTFSAFIFSLGNTTPTSATGLRNLLMTPDKDAGTGSFNRTRYSNPQFDAKMKEATAEFDPKKRVALLKDATRSAWTMSASFRCSGPRSIGLRRTNISYTANRGEDLMATLAGQCPMTAKALRSPIRPPPFGGGVPRRRCRRASERDGAHARRRSSRNRRLSAGRRRKASSRPRFRSSWSGRPTARANARARRSSPA